MSAQHFQVAVIGTQRAGIIVAALLAKRGARVLLVDHGEGAATYGRKGLQLPLVPTLVPDLSNAPHVERVIRELAIGPDLRTTVRALRPSFQALLPEHRLDISADKDTTAAELGCEFPELAGALKTFFEGLFALDAQITELLAGDPPLAPVGWMDHLRLRRLTGRLAPLAEPFDDHPLLEAIPQDHPVRDLLLSPLAFFGHPWAADPSTFQAVRLLGRYYGGAVAFPDRIGGLNGRLMQAARDAGVDLKRGAVVQAIRLEGGRVVALDIVDDRMTYSADWVIAATRGPFSDLLPPGKQHARFTADQQSVRRVGTLLTTNLVVRKAVIPRGMGEAVFLLNGRRAPRGEAPRDPPLFLRRYPAERTGNELSRKRERGDASEVGGDHEVLSVACPAPLDDVLRSPERLEALKALLFERVRRVVPFLEEHIMDRSFAVDTAGWDLEGANRRVDPTSIHPLFAAGDLLYGVGGRSPKTTLKNVLHCGPDVLPGLGIEGDYATGLTAADLITRKWGKTWQRR